MDQGEGPGRPKRYCRRSCRQRDYEARGQAAEVGLSERELIVARDALDRLHDDLYVLECAVADVESDLQSAETKDDVRRALEWLLSSAKPLVGRRL